MKKFKLIFASLLLMAGAISSSVSAAAAVNIAETDPSQGQVIPGSLDLAKGTFNTNDAGKMGKVKDVTIGENTFPTLDSFCDGCSVSYDITAAEASVYKLTFAAACNLGGSDEVKLNFRITDKNSNQVEANVDQVITKNGNWSDFSTTYNVDVPKLSKGAKTLLITFQSGEGKYTTNVADVKFEAAGTSNINGISASGKNKDKTYYNLSGMRVVSPQKGQVYVTEGKKIWVK